MRFVAVAAGLPVSALVIWALIRSPLARRVTAEPRRDRWHRSATPLLGGVGIFAGFVAAVAVAVAAGAAPADRAIAGILGGCAILFLAGLADDVFSLRPVV